MRYEHLTLDISTAALAHLQVVMAPFAKVYVSGGPLGMPKPAAEEVMNLFNEIEARLQRRDQDPKAAVYPSGSTIPFVSAKVGGPIVPPPTRLVVENAIARSKNHDAQWDLTA